LASRLAGVLGQSLRASQPGQRLQRIPPRGAPRDVGRRQASLNDLACASSSLRRAENKRTPRRQHYVDSLLLQEDHGALAPAEQAMRPTVCASSGPSNDCSPRLTQPRQLPEVEASIESSDLVLIETADWQTTRQQNELGSLFKF